MTNNPRFSRQYGRRYHSLDQAASIASLGERRLGKVRVDCKLRMSQAQWGTLNATETPAGILYMDLTFDQPVDCKLRRATVLVTLSASNLAAPPRHPGAGPGDNRDSHLLVTEHYGPQCLVGDDTRVESTKTYHLTPNLTVLGNGGGGVGVDRERRSTDTGRWTFTGRVRPGSGQDDGGNGPDGCYYRTLKWELTENHLETGPCLRPEFQTGFAFEYARRPFYMSININGELYRPSDRVKHRLSKLRFAREKPSVTLVDVRGTTQFTQRLDRVVVDLPTAMQQENSRHMAFRLLDIDQTSSPAEPEEAADSLGSLDVPSQSVAMDSPAALTAAIHLYSRDAPRPVPTTGASERVEVLEEQSSRTDVAEISPETDPNEVLNWVMESPVLLFLLQIIARMFLSPSRKPLATVSASDPALLNGSEMGIQPSQAADQKQHILLSLPKAPSEGVRKVKLN
ncbi:hypothetical protein ASPZODRAFT_137492 [Penicilliopsis zonata CBS 506.65]|uniref:Uncharacterized protein n=1 Tax=Penicilliopsis zonata CBS 506.65 TaxID=1073090 RepID=A0A1L9S4Q3_9EURO|nr:hypothetical protein ASPZODRAFT_137492 [Penicilliopsis zonata CBS 506.65]OJJ42103.1 hypothetical protein ASPZODRAFT_137492 [Penicilliopsis zonata CBS 506.65]